MRASSSLPLVLVGLSACATAHGAHVDVPRDVPDPHLPRWSRAFPPATTCLRVTIGKNDLREANLGNDVAALARCGAAMKKADGLSSDLLVYASPETPFRVVIAAMDALAVDYPRVGFGVMR